MAAGWPTDVSYVDGDVYSASDVNDTNGTLNYIDPTSATDGQVLTRDNASPGKVKWAAATVAESLGFTAGKNKVINGDFFVNQRAFTSTTTTGIFGFDRWYLQTSTGTATYSAETFTLGAAPVAGYEGTNFARLVTSGQTASSGFAGLLNKVEGVRTYAGETVTLSFWAKASSGTPKVQPTLEQDFGVSGSAGVQVAGTAVTISTSWARYSATMAVPSISGKTIGVNNTLIVQLYTSLGTNYPAYGNIGVQDATIDIWGVQLESGSTATAFQTATGTIQGELAACQRYYYRFNGSATSNYIATGYASSTTVAYAVVRHPITMRTNPSFSSSAANTFAILGAGGGSGTVVSGSNLNVDTFVFNFTKTATLTANSGLLIYSGNNGFYELSAEL